MDMKQIQSMDKLDLFKFLKSKPGATHFKIGQHIVKYISCVCVKFGVS